MKDCDIINYGLNAIVTEAEATEETTTPVESEKEEEEEIVSEIIEETKEEVEEESSTPVIKETPEGETTPPAETIYKKPEEKPKPTPTNTSSKKQYGIQILALSEYSETRVRNFCKQHGLDYNLISKENIDGLTKIRYGKSTSATEVQTLKEELINKGLKGVFMVALP